MLTPDEVDCNQDSQANISRCELFGDKKRDKLTHKEHRDTVT